jgi:D-tyrosyl-tRNA(Tyr) deacylase
MGCLRRQWYFIPEAAMIALIQRVNYASLSINGKQYSSIDKGLVVLLGIEKSDTRAQGEKLLQKVLDYRVFADAEGRMNLSVTAIGGQVMLVSQFTLAADTGRGLRPSFTSAMPPSEAEALYHDLVRWFKASYPQVVTGQFGADMKILLENDGPVTFSLRA